MHFANLELLEPGLITSLIKCLTKKIILHFANFEFLKPGLLTSLIKYLVVPAPDIQKIPRILKKIILDLFFLQK